MGSSILVIWAMVSIPSDFETRTIDFARSRASSIFVMNPAFPHFTSKTSLLNPSAAFLEMIDAVINPMHGTVAVTSRVAYMILSVGAI